MKTVCLRPRLPIAALVVMLAASGASAQTTTDAAAAASLASRIAPLAGVRSSETVGGSGSPLTEADDQRRPANPQPQGPMTVTPIRNAFVIAPTVKFGTINHRSATLAGATAGVLMEDRLFFGAGGFWLANNDRGFQMGYGGGVVGWYINGGGAVSLALTGLVGAGWSTMTWNGIILPYEMGRHGQPIDTGYGIVRGWFVDDGFLVAEPEANLCIRINRSVYLNAGVSYRFVSGAHALDNDLRGVTGSVAITFGRR